MVRIRLLVGAQREAFALCAAASTGTVVGRSRVLVLRGCGRIVGLDDAVAAVFEPIIAEARKIAYDKSVRRSIRELQEGWVCTVALLFVVVAGFEFLCNLVDVIPSSGVARFCLDGL